MGTQIRFCHVDHLLKAGVKPTSFIEEEDEISDLPWYSEGGDASDMSRLESDAIQDETVTYESSRATPSPLTMSRHNSRT